MSQSRYLKLSLKIREGVRGFSLAEVLASITLIGLFVAVGLQAMVSAVALETSTGKNQQADTWIQTDLETVRLIASQLPAQSRLCQGQSGGYGRALWDALGAEQISRPFTVDKKAYTLTRELQLSPDPNILVVQYQVLPQTGGAAIAQRRVEVMPHAAFSCP